MRCGGLKKLPEITESVPLYDLCFPMWKKCTNISVVPVNREVIAPETYPLIFPWIRAVNSEYQGCCLCFLPRSSSLWDRNLLILCGVFEQRRQVGI
jgi:hypothetical protein